MAPAVLDPMPQSASVGRCAMTSHQLSWVSRKMPPGLPKPVASLARNLLSPMPTAQESPVSAATAALTASASACGSPVPVPRNASSHPSTSTTTGNSRRVVITRSETAR